MNLPSVPQRPNVRKVKRTSLEKRFCNRTIFYSHGTLDADVRITCSGVEPPSPISTM